MLGLRPSRLAAAAAIAASLIVTAAACGGSSSSSSGSPGSGSPSAGRPLTQAQLLAGSRKEKGLLIYANVLTSQMQPVIKAFQAKYPWIQVTASDDEDPVVFSKYAAQHATGSRTADTRGPPSSAVMSG